MDCLVFHLCATLSILWFTTHFEATDDSQNHICLGFFILYILTLFRLTQGLQNNHVDPWNHLVFSESVVLAIVGY